MSDDFKYSPPSVVGWWVGRAYDDPSAAPHWFDVKQDSFGALVVTTTGPNGIRADVPVQCVPCVWRGPYAEKGPE